MPTTPPTSLLDRLAAARTAYDTVAAVRPHTAALPTTTWVEPPELTVRLVIEQPADAACDAAATLRNPEGLDAAERRETRVTVRRSLATNRHLPLAAQERILNGDDRVAALRVIPHLRDPDTLASIIDLNDSNPPDHVVLLQHKALARLQQVAVETADADAWRMAAARTTDATEPELPRYIAEQLTDDELAASPQMVAATERLARCDGSEEALRRIVADQPEAALWCWVTGKDNGLLRARHVSDVPVKDPAPLNRYIRDAAQRVLSPRSDAEEVTRFADLASHPALTGLAASAIGRSHTKTPLTPRLAWLLRHAPAVLRAHIAANFSVDDVDALREGTRDLTLDDVLAAEGSSRGRDLPVETIVALCDHPDETVRRSALERAVSAVALDRVEHLRPGTLWQAVEEGLETKVAANMMRRDFLDQPQRDQLFNLLLSNSSADARRAAGDMVKLGEVTSELMAAAVASSGSAGNLWQPFLRAASSGHVTADAVARVAGHIDTEACNQLARALLRCQPPVSDDHWRPLAPRLMVRTIAGEIHDSSAALRALGDLAVEVLGDDAAAWNDIDAAAPGWSGTWRELLDTIAAVRA